MRLQKDSLLNTFLAGAIYLLNRRWGAHRQIPFVINRVPTTQKVVALTFDADVTPKMASEMRTGRVAQWYDISIPRTLTTLEVPATFFLTGCWAELHAKIAETLSKNSLFEFGNHGYSHSGFSALSHKLQEHKSEIIDEHSIEKTEKILRVYPCFQKLFRFPDQEENFEKAAAIRALGYTLVKGNIMGADVRVKASAKIVRRVVSAVIPGSIIGLHLDNGTHAPKTGVALPIIIQKLRAKGYRFVKVSELLKLRN